MCGHAKRPDKAQATGRHSASVALDEMAVPPWPRRENVADVARELDEAVRDVRGTSAPSSTSRALPLQVRRPPESARACPAGFQRFSYTPDALELWARSRRKGCFLSTAT